MQLRSIFFLVTACVFLPRAARAQALEAPPSAEISRAPETHATLSIGIGAAQLGPDAGATAALDALLVHIPAPASALPLVFGGNARLLHEAGVTDAAEFQAALGVAPRTSTTTHYRALLTGGYSVAASQRDWILDSTTRRANTGGAVVGTRQGLVLSSGSLDIALEGSLEYLAGAHGDGESSGWFSATPTTFQVDRDGLRAMVMVGVGGLHRAKPTQP